MSKFSTFSMSLSLAALCAAAPASAQVTAEELWAEWQAMAATMGQTVTAEASPSGNGLVLQNFRSESSMDGATTTASLDTITMVNNADGTVTITASPLYEIDTEIVEDGEIVARVTFEVRHSGFEMTASGTPEARNYRYVADEVTLEEGEITAVDGGTATAPAAPSTAAPGKAGDTPPGGNTGAVASGGGEVPEIDLLMRLADLDVTYDITNAGTEEARFSSEGSLGPLELTLFASAPPGEAGVFNFSLNMGSSVGSSSGNLAAISAMQRAGGQMETLPENFDIAGDISYETLAYTMSFQEPGESFNADVGNSGGAVSFSFGEGGFAYDITGRGTRISAQSSEFPIPIDLAAEATRFAISVPLAPEPQPSDMSLLVDYQNLTLNDQLWSMFDPMQALPRDPATVTLDVTGTVQMMANLMQTDPDTLAGPPGELRTLDLNGLLVRAVGAQLSANGALTFAPGQIVPQPVGSINVNVQGMNALLDRLTQIGMPPQQAGMIRGMAGMFARPGAGPDEIESTIEFLPGGGVTANGVPLQ